MDEVYHQQIPHLCIELSLLFIFLLLATSQYELALFSENTISAMEPQLATPNHYSIPETSINSCYK